MIIDSFYKERAVLLKQFICLSNNIVVNTNIKQANEISKLRDIGRDVVIEHIIRGYIKITPIAGNC